MDQLSSRDINEVVAAYILIHRRRKRKIWYSIFPVDETEETVVTDQLEEVIRPGKFTFVVEDYQKDGTKWIECGTYENPTYFQAALAGDDYLNMNKDATGIILDGIDFHSENPNIIELILGS